MRQTLTEDPAINTAARNAQLDIFPQIKTKDTTEPEEPCGETPASTFLILLSAFARTFFYSIFSTQLTLLPMGGLYLKHVAVAALFSVLATGTLGSPVAAGPEPIRCAPCSPEKLSQCPAVAPGCAEVLREPGCGCCLACALKPEELCGIYTAPCSSGLRCIPRPGDPRPLQSLTRGQAVCTESPEPEATQEPGTPDQGEPETEMENAASDPGSSLFLPGHSKPYDSRAAADVQESMKAKLIRRKLVEQGPCHVELQRALDKIAKSQQKLGDKLTRFYLPNCDKNGLYKPKQCESSLDGQRGRCWCVNPWNGKKILGSTDLPADAECP